RVSRYGLGHDTSVAKRLQRPSNHVIQPIRGSAAKRGWKRQGRAASVGRPRGLGKSRTGYNPLNVPSSIRPAELMWVYSTSQDSLGSTHRASMFVRPKGERSVSVSLL